MGQAKAWKQVKAEWRDVVLVCRKCSKKLDGGFGPDRDQPLAKALRRWTGRQGVGRQGAGRKLKPRRRSLAVIEIGCLDICPRDAVVTMRADAPHRWLLVPEGADLGEIAARLGLDRTDAHPALDADPAPDLRGRTFAIDGALPPAS